jgi:hypothetical protein
MMVKVTVSAAAAAGATALIAHNWLLVITVIVVACLMLLRVAETNAAVANVLGPVGRALAQKHASRVASHQQDTRGTILIPADLVIPKVIPDDYDEVKINLERTMSRVERLERRLDKG